MAATYRRAHRGTPAGKVVKTGQFVLSGQFGLMVPWPSGSMIAIFQLLRESKDRPSNCFTRGMHDSLAQIEDSQERRKCGGY